MGIARRIRRMQQKQNQANYISVLANLCGDFYEFLSSDPKPKDQEIRDTFNKMNDLWLEYCLKNKLMNADQMFITNIREAWKRHSQLPSK